MNFVLHRTRTLATNKGHIVEFIKGLPTYVPPELYDDATAIGAIPEDELPETELPPGVVEPNGAAERQAALFTAFGTIVTRGRRDDFAASGAPGAKAVNDLLGWPVQAKERMTAWEQFKLEQGQPE
jgi:hypothetical protein